MGEDQWQLEDRFMDKVIKNQREKRESLKLQERLAARQLRASKVQDTHNNSCSKHPRKQFWKPFPFGNCTDVQVVCLMIACAVVGKISYEYGKHEHEKPKSV